MTSSALCNSESSFVGRINAHLWVEEGDAPQASGIMINTYARIIGTVRQQGDTKSILIYKILPVKTVNEVNTHYLEVVNARYQAEEYYRGGSGAGGAAGVSKMEVDSVGGAISQNSVQGFPAKGKESVVFNAITAAGASHPETGISKQELCKKFPHINANEMTNLLEKMASDGHVYSTVDADHFLSCI